MSSNLSLWSAAVGSLLPVVIAWIKREHWSAQVQTWFAVGVCVIASLVTTYLAGKFDVKDIATSLTAVFLLTKTTYLAVWKNTKVPGTSLGKSKAAGK